MEKFFQAEIADRLLILKEHTEEDEGHVEEGAARRAESSERC